MSFFFNVLAFIDENDVLFRKFSSAVAIGAALHRN
jgi:hypothetical protein